MGNPQDEADRKRDRYDRGQQAGQDLGQALGDKIQIFLNALLRVLDPTIPLQGKEPILVHPLVDELTGVFGPPAPAHDVGGDDQGLADDQDGDQDQQQRQEKVAHLARVEGDERIGHGAEGDVQADHQQPSQEARTKNDRHQQAGHPGIGANVAADQTAEVGDIAPDGAAERLGRPLVDGRPRRIDRFRCHAKYRPLEFCIDHEAEGARRGPFQ